MTGLTTDLFSFHLSSNGFLLFHNPPEQLFSNSCNVLQNIFPTKFEVHLSDDEEEDLVVFEQALIPATTIQQTAPERGKGLSLQKKFRGTYSISSGTFLLWR